MAEAGTTIIIKKVKKSHAGHHGGSWKVAYADFVTAMMAFFLLLWLLNSVTEEQMTGIADYFSPTAASRSQSGAGGILGGQSMLSPGAMKSPRSAAGVTVSLMPLDNAEEPDREGVPSDAKIANAETVRKALEQQDFKKAQKALRTAIEGSPELRKFSKNLIVDMTPQGMRIQIADADKRSMFPTGSSEMYSYTHLLLQKIVQVIKPMPNDIAVIGHTDATPYRATSGYSNWELSSDRANASRRALIAEGLPAERIVRVVGKADQDPLVKTDPFSAQNRRISILLLRRAGTDAAKGKATAAEGTKAGGAAHKGTAARTTAKP